MLAAAYSGPSFYIYMWWGAVHLLVVLLGVMGGVRRPYARRSAYQCSEVLVACWQCIGTARPYARSPIIHR